MESGSIQEFDQINQTVNDMIMEYVKRKKLLDPSVSKREYEQKADEFDRADPLNDPKLLQLSIAYQQLKGIVTSQRERLAELDAESIVVANQPEPNNKKLKEIDTQMDRSQHLLNIALDRFSTFSNSQFQGTQVMGQVAKYKALCLENQILERATGKTRPTVVPDYSEENPGIIDKYREYQDKLRAVDHSIHGLGKYRDYMTFMMAKDSNGVSNRRQIRDFEKAHTDDIVLANPNYKKGKNTVLDMSRYDACKQVPADMPIPEYKINEFFANKPKDKQKEEQER